MVSLLSKGAPLCLCSHILALCNYDWNPASDREIATFCFSPYIQCLKKKKKETWKVHTTKIVQLNKSLAAPRFTLHAFAQSLYFPSKSNRYITSSTILKSPIC